MKVFCRLPEIDIYCFFSQLLGTIRGLGLIAWLLLPLCLLESSDCKLCRDRACLLPSFSSVLSFYLSSVKNRSELSIPTTSMMKVFSLLSAMMPSFYPVLPTFSRDCSLRLSCAPSGGESSFCTFWLLLLVFWPKLNTSEQICLCLSGSWALALGGVTLIAGPTWTPSSFFSIFFSTLFSFL